MEGSMKNHEGYTYLKQLQYRRTLDQVMEKSLHYMNCLDENNIEKSQSLLGEFFHSPVALETAPKDINREELEEFSDLLSRALDIPEVRQAMQEKIDEEKSTALISIKLGLQMLMRQMGDDLEEGRGSAAAERFLAQPFLQEESFYLEAASRAQRALNLLEGLPLRKAQQAILELFLMPDVKNSSDS